MRHPRSPDEVAHWAHRFASKAGAPLTLLPTERGRLALRAGDGGLELRWPVRASAELVEHFLERQQAWIERQRRRYADIATAQRAALRWQLHDGALQMFGTVLPLRFDAPAGQCEITLHAIHLGFSGPTEAARRALAATALARLQRDLQTQARLLAVDAGLKARALSLRNMRSLWGSCSYDGRIRLNSALVGAAPAVTRYVLVHELAHLDHRDHSPRFWARVAEMEPDYPHYRQVLRQDHAVLLRLGAWLFAPLAAGGPGVNVPVCAT